MSAIFEVPRVAVWTFPNKIVQNRFSRGKGTRIGIANSASELKKLLDEAKEAPCVAVQVRKAIWIQSGFDRIHFTNETAST